MAPRPTAMRDRDYDFGNVGTAGRRTGITMEQRPRDDYGFEQVSGIFSSPHKPSPLKSMINVEEPRRDSSTQTPRQSTTQDRTSRGTSGPPPPRSASPKKSGIRGTARRSNVMDVGRLIGTNQIRDEESGNQPEIGTPQMTIKASRPNTLMKSAARRFSPQKTPLRNQVLGESEHGQTSPSRSSHIGSNGTPTRKGYHNNVEYDANHSANEDPIADLDGNIMGTEDEDDDLIPRSGRNQEDEDLPMPTTEPNDEDEGDQRIFVSESPSSTRGREITTANSRRKRKSDVLDDEAEFMFSPEPKTGRKRNKIQAERSRRDGRHDEAYEDESEEPEARMTESEADEAEEVARTKQTSRPPLAQKNKNAKMSSRQEKELNDIVEKVRARPGQQKSLYILRRETPADDHVARTRSGRISVKPLAYWRNERCVYGGSPGGPSLEDGARFPLNSIREIIRTEEVAEDQKKKRKQTAKKSKRKVDPDVHELSESEPEEVESQQQPADPHAEEWETEDGTFRGLVSVWDSEQQAPVEQDEEVELAHAPGAIQTKEVKGSTFRYAKLLSTKFFGSGIVDLPPGGIKRTKNSRKMHMSFFVAKGRVTVQVGPLNGPESRFSVGKGGFWQVPRGNQYSIENELEKPARVFFSQACETVPQDSEE